MQIRAELASCPLFEDLPEEVLSLLADSSEVVRLSGHTSLFRQGDPGDALYLVARGRLAAVLETDGEAGETFLGDIGPGSYVGEMALLTAQQRVATVVAVRDSSLIRVPASAFLRVAADHPECALSVARTVIERSHPGPRVQADRFRTLAVVPGGIGTAARLRDFSEALRTALATIGTTALIDRAALRERFSDYGAERDPDHEDATVAGFLDRLEGDHRFVIYANCDDDARWHERCIRNADRILVVVGADDAAADPAAVAALLQAYRHATLAPAELVVWHPDDRIRAGVARRWLATGIFRRHYHVRRQRGDIPRLARLLVGRAYGMAFSGGGLRAVAFVGVLRAFQEAGIEIDVFAGTSGGAIVGGMAATEVPWQEMEKRAWQVCKLRRWTELGPPLVSIASGRLPSTLFRAYYGDTDLEDTPRPFLAICLSVASGRLVVPERGELWRAVRASTSLPAIFPPVPYGDDLLVDGGLVNNLPVDLIRDRCETVVGCDVSQTSTLPVPSQDAYAVSGWTVAWRRFGPFSGREIDLPSLMSTLQRAGMAAAREHRVKMDDVADLMIVPDVAGLGLFNTDPPTFTRLLRCGYEAAVQALEKAELPAREPELAAASAAGV